MKVTGLHVLAEIHDCDESVLKDLNQVETLMKDTAGENRFIVEDSVFHQFTNEGISGVVISPLANLSIHTWPESRRATIDMVTCREDQNPMPFCESLVSKFMASHMTASSQIREIDIGPDSIAV
jgi:S-adenosylmethionine decarboxylase